VAAPDAEKEEALITDDPRFVRGVELFNSGDYFDANEEFEDLYFEGVRDEPEFVRTFLQFAVGIHHAQTGQRRPAIERIEEGLKIAAPHDYGIDVEALRRGMRDALGEYKRGRNPRWPKIMRR
jgi:predicted metal-dependent hydrolase